MCGRGRWPLGPRFWEDTEEAAVGSGPRAAHTSCSGDDPGWAAHLSVFWGPFAGRHCVSGALLACLGFIRHREGDMCHSRQSGLGRKGDNFVPLRGPPHCWCGFWWGISWRPQAGPYRRWLWGKAGNRERETLWHTPHSPTAASGEAGDGSLPQARFGPPEALPSCSRRALWPPHAQGWAPWDQPGVLHTRLPTSRLGGRAFLGSAPPSARCTRKRAPHPLVHRAGGAGPSLAVLGASGAEAAVFPGWNVQNVGWAPGSSPQPALTPLAVLGSQFSPS